MRTACVISILLIAQIATAQSVVVSGSRNSIIVSGKAAPGVAAPTIETPVVQQQKPAAPKTAKTCSCSARCTCGCNAGLPCKCGQKQQPAVAVTQAAGERFLISEKWCGLCPEARRKFLASGGKKENILTMNEARQRHGVVHNPPFEYTSAPASLVSVPPLVLGVQTQVVTHRPLLPSKAGTMSTVAGGTTWRPMEGALCEIVACVLRYVPHSNDTDNQRF